jgi:cobalt-zinc-cadmium efflux system outer membrane protein
MYVKSVLFVFLYLFLKVSVSLSGETRLELDTVTDTVLHSNPELAVFENKWEAARHRIISMSSLEDPELGVEFEGIPKDSIDAGKFQDIEWSFSQKWPFPGKLSLKRKIAAEEAQKVYHEFLEKSQNLLALAKQTYADYVLKAEILVLLQKNSVFLSQLENIIRQKYEVGKGSQQDLLLAQVEQERLQSEIANTIQEMQTTAARLNVLMGKHPESFLPPAEPFFCPVHSWSFDELMSLARQHRQEFKHHQSVIRVVELEYKLAKRQNEPDFFTRLETRQFEGTGLKEYDVMLGISIPWLWTRGKVKEGVQEAKYNLSGAQKDFEAKQNMVGFEIKESLVKVQTSQNLLNLYENTILPKSRQILQAAQSSYETDKTDFLNLIQLQRNHLAFELEYKKLQAEHFRAIAELEKSTGADLLDTEREEAESK